MQIAQVDGIDRVRILKNQSFEDPLDSVRYGMMRGSEPFCYKKLRWILTVDVKQREKLDLAVPVPLKVRRVREKLHHLGQRKPFDDRNVADRWRQSDMHGSQHRSAPMGVGVGETTDLIARAASGLPVDQPVFVPNVEDVFVDDDNDKIGALLSQGTPVKS